MIKPPDSFGSLLRNRRFLFGLIALTVIILLTLFVAPRSDRAMSGSTYNRAPDGYGAWYAYMQRQGVRMQRWRKPTDDFAKQTPGTGNTFLRVNPLAIGKGLSKADEDWIKRGNTWITLGANAPATEASFSTVQSTNRGNVKIETSRRHALERGETEVFGDRNGSIVWEEPLGKGRMIYAVTPFLAANAYQDEPGNFAFLASLAAKKIWVDEYLHGYKDPEVAKREDAKDWSVYLLKTPILPIVAQIVVLLLLLIWAKNRRFGQPMPLESPSQDNSEAYIQALAGVLHKAGRSEFVLDVVGREEQLQIQRSLGLGSTLLDLETLTSVWIEQTGRSAEELTRILSKKQRLSEKDLLTWIEQVKQVRQHLPQ